MTDADASKEAILSELAEVRASLDTLKGVVEQQQSTIAALQQRSADSQSMTPAASTIPAVATSTDAHESADNAEDAPAGMTSRRNLLRGAAVATAATVGVAALGATQTAHAANGDNLIIGVVNTETTQTTLTNTDSTNAVQAFTVNISSSASASAAITGQSTSGATGVVGWDNANGVGVHGYQNGLGGGFGVYGQTMSAGTAVYGEVRDVSGTGNGVSGSASQGIGVLGAAAGGWGVVGESNLSYDFVANGSGLIGVNVQGTAGAPTSGFFWVGDCIRDLNGELWLCTAGNGTNVGTWVRASHAHAGYAGGALNFLSVPIRVIDTRAGQNPAAPLPTTKAPLASGGTYTFQITGTMVGTSSVPAGAVGIYANVTVVFPTNGGNLIFYPADQAQPQSSTINYNQGAVVGNFTFGGLSSGGALKIFVNGPGNTDVVVDIVGFIM